MAHAYPPLTTQQTVDLDRLFTAHTFLARYTDGRRSPSRSSLFLRYVFHSPRDVRRQTLYLEDSDIRPATSREAFFLAVARALCSPLEPENWRALCNGQAFLFDVGVAVFRFILVPSHSEPSRSHWHFGKIIFDDAPLSLTQSEPDLNPWPGDPGQEQAENPGQGRSI